MIHSGLSVTGMQKFMVSLEVPPVSARTLKKREREIGVTIEKVAKKILSRCNCIGAEFM